MDILADGELDLSDSVLEQMDIVVASVHSHFNQEAPQMTDRLLRAIANPNTSLIGHPTGRQLLRREPYKFDYDKVFEAAAKTGVAMELSTRYQAPHITLVREAFAAGARFAVASDGHHAGAIGAIDYPRRLIVELEIPDDRFFLPERRLAVYV